MKVEQLPGDAYSDVRYAVSFDGPAFIVGFKLMSLLNEQVYVTLEPLEGIRGLRPSQLKALREELSKYDYNFFCQTNTPEGARFAEFFGFKHERYAWGRAHLVREKN